jgi:hypothetical protein
MIERITDNAEIVNEIGNNPSVRALMFLGAMYPPEYLDFSPWVEDPRNIILRDGGFVAMFVWRGPGIYECHLMIRKEDRGAKAMAVGKEMLQIVANEGARTVWGQPSIYNRAAICYIRRMGLKPAGFGVDAIAGEVQYFVTEGL